MLLFGCPRQMLPFLGAECPALRAVRTKAADPQLPQSQSPQGGRASRNFKSGGASAIVRRDALGVPLMAEKAPSPFDGYTTAAGYARQHDITEPSVRHHIAKGNIPSVEFAGRRFIPIDAPAPPRRPPGRPYQSTNQR
jgi:hypothetical protein